MSSDRMDWEQEDEFPGRPFGTKSFGTKPFGTKPFGTKPFGTKPFGTRPFGTKPFGTKPLEGDESGGFLDSEEWSAEVAELICERSALVRLGATLVAADHELRVPAFDFATDFNVPGEDPERGQTADAALRPGDWRLSAGVAVPRRLLGALAASAELTYTLKVDLAEALAGRADRTFLQGEGDGEPGGIATRVPSTEPGDDLLATARALVSAVRLRDPIPPPFRSPGWVLAPATLDALTKLATADGLVAAGDGARALDSDQLLQLDGIDGGVFLGYPLLSSAGAGPRIYFAADWQEAWIGVTRDFVSVEVSAEPAGADEAVIRGSMALDFTLRRQAVFAWAAA